METNQKQTILVIDKILIRKKIISFDFFYLKRQANAHTGNYLDF